MSEEYNPGLCSGSCGRVVDARCGGDHCRDCHVSLSWESCVDGTWNAQQLLKTGARTREDILKIYPDARI